MKYKIELISNFKSIINILYLFVSFPIESDSISHLIKQKSQHVKLSQQFLQNATAWLENKIWRKKRNQKLTFQQNPSWSVTEFMKYLDMIIILFLGNLEFLWICSSDLFYGYSLVIVKISASPDWRPLNVWMWYENCFRRILK